MLATEVDALYEALQDTATRLDAVARAIRKYLPSDAASICEETARLREIAAGLPNPTRPIPLRPEP